MSVTLIEVAPATTWLLVSTSPVEVSTMPVPSAVACRKACVEVTSTRPGFVRLAIVDVFSALTAEPAVAQAVPPTASAAAVTPAARISARCGRRRGAALWLGPPGQDGGGGGGGGGS